MDLIRPSFLFGRGSSAAPNVKVEEHEESSKRHRHHHRRRSDGEIEKEKLRSKVREEDKKHRHRDSSGSDKGKSRRDDSDNEHASQKRELSDKEREERRRRRRERERERGSLDRSRQPSPRAELRKQAGKEKEHSSSRKHHEHKHSHSHSSSSSRTDEEKQLILHPSSPRRISKDQRSSSSRPSSSGHRRPSHSRSRSDDHDQRSSSERHREERGKSKELDIQRKNNVLSFVLDKKDKLVQCISCRDDVARFQVAKLSCGHYFCHECLKRIFQLSLTDPAHMPPKCCTPEHIPLKYVDRLLSYKTKKQWNKKYVEYTTANRIYCSATDCGEFIPPKDISGKVGKCPKCKNKMCTICSGKAHGSNSCPKDEEMNVFVQTALEKGYQKCPGCRAVVEKIEHGCNHITCLCGIQFCYLCSKLWKTCECVWFAVPTSDEEEDDSEEEEEENESEQEPAQRVTPSGEDRDKKPEERSVSPSNVPTNTPKISITPPQAATLPTPAPEPTPEPTPVRPAQALEKAEVNNTFGTLRTNLRNNYKKLAEEYAEASRRDEEARQERIRQRLQQLNERDDAIRSARRGSTSAAQRPQRPIPERLPTRANSLPRVGVSDTVESPTSPTAAQSPLARSLFDEERAARIAQYIRGEVDEIDDDLVTPMQATPAPLLPQKTEPIRLRRQSAADRTRRPSEPIRLSARRMSDARYASPSGHHGRQQSVSAR